MCCIHARACSCVREREGEVMLCVCCVVIAEGSFKCEGAFIGDERNDVEDARTLE